MASFTDELFAWLVAALIMVFFLACFWVLQDLWLVAKDIWHNGLGVGIEDWEEED